MNNIEEENQELKETIGNLEKINFQYVGKGGKVKMIAWGKEYKSWPVEKRLEYAEALASAMNEACDVIQQERDKALQELLKAKKQLDEIGNAYNIQKQININSITKANQDKEAYVKTIRELEKELVTYKAREEAHKSIH